MKILALVLIMLFSSSVFAEANFENNDFSIQGLEHDNNKANTQVLSMCLPASEGFAPNVTVIIQQYPKTLKDYEKISMGQFKTLNFTVIQNTLKEGKLILEYTGKMKNRNFHFYAVAFKKDKRVFLVTAVATANQWKNVSQKLMNSVDSIKMK